MLNFVARLQRLRIRKAIKQNVVSLRLFEGHVQTNGIVRILHKVQCIGKKIGARSFYRHYDECRIADRTGRVEAVYHADRLVGRTLVAVGRGEVEAVVYQVAAEHSGRIPRIAEGSTENLTAGL